MDKFDIVKTSLRGVFALTSGADKKMKLAVLGATGPTGLLVVQQALAKGYEVRALVRDPEKMASLVQHDKLQVYKVDLSRTGELVSPMSGVDAVVSCLGGRAGMWNPCTVHTDTMPNIVAAMRQCSVKRLVCTSAWGAKDEDGLPWIISWFLKPTFLRHILANMAKMEDYIADNCADINYTVVRPPGLNNAPVTEKEIMTREGQFVTDAANYISRADLARFILECITVDDFNHKMVAIGVKK